ncbi:MAG TPA: MFS transporter [Geminicoccaceae bacterium]|nr:MFS transporter [Geminicoccaceae bacterium]
MPADDGPDATPTHPAGRRLLTDESFLRLWASGSLAGVLRWLELLAIGIFVLERTGSPFLVALLTFLRMAPLFLCGIPAGALADRYDRRRLLIIGLVVLALVSAVLAALAGSGRIALWHIALGTFLNGVFWSSDFPVRRTMLGEIAGTERLSRAMALESATNNATRMIGPALGGLLIATLGLYGVYLVGTILYAICVLLIFGLAYRPASARAASASFTAMLLEGWRFTRRQRVIVAALAVTVIVNLWGFAFITMIPVIGERTLGLSPTMIGLLMSTEGLGALVGALLVARFDRPRRYTQIYLGSSLLFLLGVLAFGLSRSFALSLALLLLSGIGIAGFSVMQSTIFFLAAPPAVRSRVMGLLTVSIGAGPIGMLHVGLLADWLGAANAVALIAAEGLIALALTALLWPELRREVELMPDAPQASAGATSSRTAMPSSSGDGAE